MSFPHLIVIALIALIVLGPEKLPQVARTLGKAMAEFRRITGDFRMTVEGEMRELERTVALKELREGFPEHVHYDVQQNKEAEAAQAAAAAQTIAPPATPAQIMTPPPPPGFTSADVGPAETEAAVASGKPSDGKSTSA
jgi:Tat protein translocase TatB subunit